MLIGGILVGLLLGLLAGGRIQNLAHAHLRWARLLLAALVIRFGTELALNAHIGVVETLRLPLLVAAFGFLLAGLWSNRTYPGLSLAFLGTLSNAIAIVVNGGYMPIWDVSLGAAGLTSADVNRSFHQVVSVDTSAFLDRALILGDVIPLPLPVASLRNVSSLGDVFLSLGLAFFLFAGIVRVPTEQEEREDAELRARLATNGGTGLLAAFQNQISLRRPVLLGGGRARLVAPSTAGLVMTTTVVPPTAVPLPHVAPDVLARVRRHPYVRLALNGSFSALWSGQLVSMFGDRVHQMALAATVYTFTGSALATALVFVAATLPNLLFGPIAGTLVDRWDHREVLVVSDILRAAVVLLIPIAATVNILFAYPLVFLVTTISIFFRPARVAIVPRIVREDELLTANSALWVGETIVDVIGFPLAGLFVALLAGNLSVAFWFDSATYLGSALLLSSIVARPTAIAEAAGAAVPVANFREELAAGWRFLRRDTLLLANTLQATVAQLTVGVLIGLTAVFSEQVFGRQGFDWPAVYGFIEGSQGAGNLIGGFIIGLIGMRLAKGRMIIAGYTFLGLFTTLMGLSGNLGVVLAIAFGIGVANMLFIIPSQTLFQERTPPNLIGRVVGFRFSLVSGAMALSIGFGGVLAELVGVTTVIAMVGIITMAAGLAGLLVPEVRDA